MKYVEKHTEIEQEENKTLYYNKQGALVDDDDNNIYAKSSGSPKKNSSKSKFYVMTSNGNLFDPNGIDSHRERNIRKEFKTTSKQTFDYYINYLKTRNPIFLRRAERSFING